MPTETESCKRELTIEVPPAEVRRAVERVTLTFQKRARVPGFRPGKTPLSIVRQRFGEDIRHEVLHELIPEYFDKRVKEEHLAPISGPDIKDVQLNLEAEEPLRFKAAFEVLPEFELKDYNALDVEEEEPEVTDEEVEAELKQMQEREATFEPVEDRPLQDGDYGIVVGRGHEVGSAKPAVKLDNIYCEIGGEHTLPAFTENLRGVAPGEERTFSVTYPEDYSDRRVAGRNLEYTVQVTAVKKKQVPELNDDFAKDLGDFTSLEQVRADIRGRLLEQKRRRAEHQAKDKLVEKLVDMHDFEVPEALTEQQVRSRMERTVRQIAAQGVDPSKLDVDWAKLRGNQREGAQRDVKASLILDRIAERENIEVTGAEVDDEMEQIAEQAAGGRDVEAVRARLTREGANDRIKNRLRSEKTLDFVYRRANKISRRPASENQS